MGGRSRGWCVVVINEPRNVSQKSDLQVSKPLNTWVPFGNYRLEVTTGVQCSVRVRLLTCSVVLRKLQAWRFAFQRCFLLFSECGWR